MSASLKKVGLAAVVLDLVLAGTAFAALHHSPAAPAGHARMSATALEQVLESQGVPHPSCSVDPNGGFDYVCASNDSRSLYDVSADGITQQVALP
jgi:hypothetical protein